MTIAIHCFLDCDGCSNISTRVWVLRGGAIGTPQGIRTGGLTSAAGWTTLDADTDKRRDFCPACVKAGRAK